MRWSFKRLGTFWHQDDEDDYFFSFYFYFSRVFFSSGKGAKYDHFGVD